MNEILTGIWVLIGPGMNQMEMATFLWIMVR